MGVDVHTVHARMRMVTRAGNVARFGIAALDEVHRSII
jgi:hypothetical protein